MSGAMTCQRWAKCEDCDWAELAVGGLEVHALVHVQLELHHVRTFVLYVRDLSPEPYRKAAAA
jgi:hypothetical protein